FRISLIANSGEDSLSAARHSTMKLSTFSMKILLSDCKPEKRRPLPPAPPKIVGGESPWKRSRLLIQAQCKMPAPGSLGPSVRLTQGSGAPGGEGAACSGVAGAWGTGWGGGGVWPAGGGAGAVQYPGCHTHATPFQTVAAPPEARNSG